MVKKATVALVGSESLMGREIRDLFSTGNLPAQLKLVAAAEEETGKLTAQEGEPAFVAQFEAENLSTARLVLLAGTPQSSRKALELAPATVPIDLTSALEDIPRARLRAPMLEPAGYQAPPDAVHVIAHPAAIAIGLLLNRLHARYPIRRAVIHIFEPASERGRSGLDELQQQTVNLLAFKGMPKTIFDAQLAFNMLPRYGEEAPEALADIELRIERHLTSLLLQSSKAPLPSLRLIQAPVFHGHSFSFWIEFEQNPGADELEQLLSAAPIEVRSAELEPPTNVGMAGQGGIAVGAVTPDRNHPQACWLWAVSDNLRIAAENAVAVARQLL